MGKGERGGRGGGVGEKERGGRGGGVGERESLQQNPLTE